MLPSVESFSGGAINCIDQPAPINRGFTNGIGPITGPFTPAS